jgi:LysM repeat protein
MKKIILAVLVVLLASLFLPGARYSAADTLSWEDSGASVTTVRTAGPLYFTQLKKLKESLREQQAQPAIQHTVVRGETLSLIARKYGVTVEDLVAINKIKNPDIIFPGQVLLLAGQATEKKAAATASSAHRLVHEIQPGDTVWALARKYDVEMEQIIAANGISDPRKLEVGRKLVIPVKKEAVAASTRLVAARSSTTVSRAVADWNNIRFSDVYIVQATAYCPGTTECGCPVNEKGHSVCTGPYNDGITASGLPAIAGDGSETNPHLVAVDPGFIPLGTRLYIEGYGYAVAADTGGAIRGRKLDLLLPTHQTALNFGRKQLTVYRLAQ